MSEIFSKTILKLCITFISIQNVDSPDTVYMSQVYSPPRSSLKVTVCHRAVGSIGWFINSIYSHASFMRDVCLRTISNR